jgi:[acyl-carrier-protein] S-malonyltransferase
VNRSADLDGVAAWVGAEVVTRAEVAAELERLRAGPLGARLPPDGTGEARQLRRWVAQRAVLRRLLERERDALGPGGTVEAAPRVRPDPAVVGSAAADVLATSAAARAVFASVTAGIRLPEDELRRYYARNPDQFSRPARWLLRHAFHPSDPTPLAALLAAAPPVIAAPASLPAAVLAAARAAGPAPVTVGPVRSTLGWHLVAVDDQRSPASVPYPQARAQIAGRLLDRARQLAFARWLDARCAALVRLSPGYEHPADPRQPDATHRH